MSLQNRVSVVIGIHNCGHLDFGSKVFLRLKMNLNTDLVKNLSQQDQTKQRKRKYNEKRETKVKRRRVQNEKMKDMMRKQQLDEVRGKTYQSGEAMRHLIPNEVLKIEEEIKLKGKINCGLWGCNHDKVHKSSRSKRCRYHTYHNAKELTQAVTSRMQVVYPAYFGELFCINCDIIYIFGLWRSFCVIPIHPVGVFLLVVKWGVFILSMIFG